MFPEGSVKKMKPQKSNLKEKLRMYIRGKKFKILFTTFSGTRRLKEKLSPKLNKTANLNSNLQFVINIVNMREQDDDITETPKTPTMIQKP